MATVSWSGASLFERSIVAKIRLLTDAPEEGFAEQIQVTVAVALLAHSAAMSSSIALQVLSMLLTGCIGDKGGSSKIRNRLATIKKGISRIANLWQCDYSSRSVKRRLESPFFLPSATSYPEVPTHFQQAKADSSTTLGKFIC
jgi:hypothetical protein